LVLAGGLAAALLGALALSGQPAHDKAKLAPEAPVGPGAAPAAVDAGVPEALVEAEAAVDAGEPREPTALAADVPDGGPEPDPEGPVSAQAPKAAGGDPFDKALDDARTALAQQRFKTAVVLYRRVAKLRPPTPAVLTALGIALVRSETESGYREAISYLTQGLEEEPKNAQAWLALGIAYQNLGRSEEAQGPYREYLKLRPTGAQSDEIRNALRNGTK
jgi:predicted Zn-dependent protease